MRKPINLLIILIGFILMSSVLSQDFVLFAADLFGTSNTKTIIMDFFVTGFGLSVMGIIVRYPVC
ncbi:hypothetical protein K8R32_05335 [bacterium]|nr:hypothetical protein [bacterium]